jgi:hypothetical protein
MKMPISQVAKYDSPIQRPNSKESNTVRNTAPKSSRLMKEYKSIEVTSTSGKLLPQDSKAENPVRTSQKKVGHNY